LLATSFKRLEPSKSIFFEFKEAKLCENLGAQWCVFLSGKIFFILLEKEKCITGLQSFAVSIQNSGLIDTHQNKRVNKITYNFYLVLSKYIFTLCIFTYTLLKFFS